MLQQLDVFLSASNPPPDSALKLSSLSDVSTKYGLLMLWVFGASCLRIDPVSRVLARPRRQVGHFFQIPTEYQEFLGSCCYLQTRPWSTGQCCLQQKPKILHFLCQAGTYKIHSSHFTMLPHPVSILLSFRGGHTRWSQEKVPCSSF
jgi:hypothetical protein